MIREAIPGKTVAQHVNVEWSLNDKTYKSSIPYLIFLPNNYEQREEPWPLMIFLHGAGQRGNGGNDLQALLRHGPPKLVLDRRDFPFIVVSPQSPPPPKSNLFPQAIMAMVDHVSENYRVDRRRIVATGLSLGGNMTFNLAAAFPDRIAAAIPISGPGNPDQAPQLAKMPLWVFFGEQDGPDRVQKTVAAIKAAGNENVRLVIYPGVGHNAWTQTYRNEEIYTWLLEQKLSD